MSVVADFLIVGQGLAGTLLAIALMEKGASVHVADLPGTLPASPVAPGIINPLAGRKFEPLSHFLPHYHAAARVYEASGTRFKKVFFHPLPLLRFLEPDSEISAEVRSSSVVRRSFDARFFSSLLNDDAGTLELSHSGWLDVAGFCTAWKAELHLLGRIRPLKDRAAAYNPDLRYSYKTIVYCEGWTVSQNPYFKRIPWSPSLGEVLLVELDAPLNLPEVGSCILNRGKWLLPRKEKLFWCGSTYVWSDFASRKALEGTDEILAGISKMVRQSLTLKECRRGVRPATTDHSPVAGRHPVHTHIALFNGLGSRGVLLAPLLAEQLARNLIHEQVLPEASDIMRFRKLLF